MCMRVCMCAQYSTVQIAKEGEQGGARTHVCVRVCVCTAEYGMAQRSPTQRRQSKPRRGEARQVRVRVQAPVGPPPTTTQCRMRLLSSSLVPGRLASSNISWMRVRRPWVSVTCSKQH